MRNRKENIQLLISIPAYNEANVIADSVRAVAAVLEKEPYSWHLLVASNASTDDTLAKVLEIKDPRISVISVPEKGKGNAVRSSAELAKKMKTTWFGFIDADLSASPAHIPSFVNELHGGTLDIIVGSRLLQKERIGRSYVRTFTSQTFNVLRKLLFGISVYDTQCGLKVFNQRGVDILVGGKEGGWFWDVEFLASAQRGGLTIKEVPIDWDEFRYEGRKSKLNLVRDGISAIVALIRIRLRMLNSR